MLHEDVKRKVNNLRDILVTRFPDPKTQDDQIIMAMIYKFIDDIDVEFMRCEDFGKRRFFINDETMDYEKYAWSNIMQPQVSGEERAKLYLEGIKSIARNPHIPQVFQDVFINAYMPFEDSETINRLLGAISDFKYDSSKDLGNVFEMLLAIIYPRGDKGQFITPRHITDMIVEIVDPSNSETILDPACGTAGFLISSYKHILKKNTDIEEKTGITTSEQELLSSNIVGYDISPDMVRLSCVNMYLHHLMNPKIFEYNTLTDETRWNDDFDVILSNLPFITPKGGISPHSRFKLKARRSEVLFVEYIAEHLTPHGKAGIIVPEGIVQQTSNAYKELRRMLIEDNYLYALISLPEGVFNPYSSIKTSMLFFDRAIAKEADSILFIKIENDGYDLTPRRRKIKESDIPGAIEIIKKYKKAVMFEKGNEKKIVENDCAILVPKKDILEETNNNVLVWNRYRTTLNNQSSKWDMVELGEVLDCEQPAKYLVNSTDYSGDGTIAVLSTSKDFISGYTNETEGAYSSELPVIIFNDITTAMQLVDFKFKVKSTSIKILRANAGKADVKYLYFMMKNLSFESSLRGRYWVSQYSKIKIPLPPLSIQREIVKELEEYQKEIENKKEVIRQLNKNIDNKISEIWRSKF